jgi:PPP family 3-phenylpropionic acid transporter
MGSAQAFAVRLGAFYTALFLAFGVQLPFFPLWLKDRGLDPAVIGLVLSIPMVVRVVAIPLASRYVDRREAARHTLAAALAVTAIGYACAAFADTTLLLVLACAVAATAYAPVTSLTDAYALKGLAAHGKPYGPVRLWGSLAFLAGMFAAGAAIDIMPASRLIWLMVGGMGLAALTAMLLKPSPGTGGVDPGALRPASFWRQPLFIAVLAAASLIQGSHALYYGFSAVAWRNAGFEGSTVAALWALGVIAEILLFALQSRFPGWLTAPRLLMIGAAGAVLRWSLMALDPPALLLPVLQLLHALSFGATHLGAVTYLAQLAPPGYSARAQGYLAMALGLGSALAMSMAGALYGALGAGAYAAMALMAAAGGAGAFVAQRLERGVTE